ADAGILLVGVLDGVRIDRRRANRAVRQLSSLVGSQVAGVSVFPGGYRRTDRCRNAFCKIRDDNRPPGNGSADHATYRVARHEFGVPARPANRQTTVQENYVCTARFDRRQRHRVAVVRKMTELHLPKIATAVSSTTTATSASHATHSRGSLFAGTYFRSASC